MTGSPLVYDIGGGSGEWSRPYRKAGYDVRVIDPRTWPFMRARDVPKGKADIVLLAPPCTEFAVSGARWWAGKSPDLLRQAKETAYEFLEVLERTSPDVWALENPVGRLGSAIPELGRHRYTWHPWHYGDPETKLTCMWGSHAEPTRSPVPGPYNAKVHRMAPGHMRAFFRSITPPGFAQAFYESNKVI